MSLSKELRCGDDPPAALALTQRHVLVAALVAALVVAALGCATGSKAGMGASVDFVDASGREATLGSFAGKIVVLDVCASWATACNLNAKVLDEVAAALAAKKRGDDVVFITVLLDEGQIGRVAMQSYVETLGVTHPVFMASSRVRAGTSVLGEASYVPRIVLFDREGRVRLDHSGGVVNVEGLLAKVEALL
jgi:cytochrome oxidase Cu insertion factor (SCO1/SenC/PrrC family)